MGIFGKLKTARRRIRRRRVPSIEYGVFYNKKLHSSYEHADDAEKYMGKLKKNRPDLDKQKFKINIIAKKGLLPPVTHALSKN